MEDTVLLTIGKFDYIFLLLVLSYYLQFGFVLSTPSVGHFEIRLLSRLTFFSASELMIIILSPNSVPQVFVDHLHHIISCLISLVLNAQSVQRTNAKPSTGHASHSVKRNHFAESVHRFVSLMSKSELLLI